MFSFIFISVEGGGLYGTCAELPTGNPYIILGFATGSPYMTSSPTIVHCLSILYCTRASFPQPGRSHSTLLQ